MKNGIFIGLACVFASGCFHQEPYKVTLSTSDKFDQPETVFVQGEEIHIQVNIKNQSIVPKNIVFTSGQQFEVEIFDESGTRVWKRSDDVMFTQALSNIVLDPDETHEAEVIWKQTKSLSVETVPAGRYKIKGYYLGVDDEQWREIDIQ